MTPKPSRRFEVLKKRPIFEHKFFQPLISIQMSDFLTIKLFDMQKSLIILFVLSLSLHASAQIRFEPGYFVNNNNEVIHCLIKNVEWKNNPFAFEYKLSEEGEVKTGDASGVKEFSIGEHLKYKSFEVEIDRSSERIDEISWEGKENWSREILFLKAHIEGKASLYSYTDGSLIRYFFGVDDEAPKQLIYQVRKVDNINLSENHRYRSQLASSLQCKSLSERAFRAVNYYKNDLKRIIEQYNACMGAESKDYDKKYSFSFVNLSIKAGLNYPDFKSHIPTIYQSNSRMDRKASVRGGLEVELMLPFNKNKWSLIFAPTFQSFRSSGREQNGWRVSIDYRSIELPLGIRHYFYISDNSRIFLNASFVLDSPIDSKITRRGAEFKIQSTANFAFGAGYSYRDRLSIEIQQSTARALFRQSTTWITSYTYSSLVLGFRLF